MRAASPGTLVPNETKALSVNEIIGDKIRYHQGRKIDGTSTSGAIQWFTSIGASGLGRLLVSNPYSGLTRNFSCQTNFNMCSASFGTDNCLDTVYDTDAFYSAVSPVTCVEYSSSSCSQTTTSSRPISFTTNRSGSYSSTNRINAKQNTQLGLHSTAAGSFAITAYVQAGSCSSAPLGGGGSVHPPNVTFQNTTVSVGQGQSVANGLLITDRLGNPLTLSSSTPVVLSVNTVAGSGAATLSNMSFTSSGSFSINGSSASSQSYNLQITASITLPMKDGSGNHTFTVATALITVVNVSLSLQPVGSIPADNGASRGFGNQLGPFIASNSGITGKSCFVGYQVTGVVTPSDYTGQITLRRTATSTAIFRDPPLGSPNINTAAQDDTSSAAYLDSVPQSGGSAGKIYDLDDPGYQMSSADKNTVRRTRDNFRSYAVLGSSSSTALASANLSFYVRLSCTLDGPGNPSFDHTYSSDNNAGLGSVSLSESQ